MIRCDYCSTYLWMFSMSWKLVPLSAILLIEFGWILFIRWQRTTPSFNTSSNLYRNIITVWKFCFRKKQYPYNSSIYHKIIDLRLSWKFLCEDIWYPFQTFCFLVFISILQRLKIKKYKSTLIDFISLLIKNLRLNYYNISQSYILLPPWCKLGSHQGKQV